MIHEVENRNLSVYTRIAKPISFKLMNWRQPDAVDAKKFYKRAEKAERNVATCARREASNSISIDAQ